MLEMMYAKTLKSLPMTGFELKNKLIQKETYYHDKLIIVFSNSNNLLTN